mgnify:CR=1 FL=1
MVIGYERPFILLIYIDIRLSIMSGTQEEGPSMTKGFEENLKELFWHRVWEHSK